jgi:Bacterial virulence factor lipase N-terminal
MSQTSSRAVWLSLCCTLLASGPAWASGVHVVSEPFPSDRFTVRDRTQNTGRRVQLPKPSCAARPSDCADIDVINTLDGFNLQPRLRVVFDGPIDVSTVSSNTVFLFRLGSTLLGGPPPGRVVGINQVVWDPVATTLYAESDELLEEHTRYLLIVTSGVHDRAGDPLAASAEFLRLLRDPLPEAVAVRGSVRELKQALALAEATGAALHRVIAASLFTTQSASATLEKIRRQLQATAPSGADFHLGADGSATVFPLAAIGGITFNRQVATSTFVPTPVPVIALSAFPGAVGSLAFGRYNAPDYETAAGFIPATGTRSGVPAVQRRVDVFFTLFLPAGPPPAHGWPVALFGHGFGDNKNNSPYAVAGAMAAQGLATVAINVVGHGGGEAGTLSVALTDGSSVTLPAGGRSVDQNGDSLIDATEGVSALPPQDIIGSRDGLRQTVVDLMQLVRVIEAGVDVDGDGQPDLDPARVYYFGQSFGGIYGTTFLAIEPRVRVGVANVGGGSISDILRLGSFRPLLGALLAARMPSLLNLPGNFNENLPLRNQPPVVNTVPGALEIQEYLEHLEWVSQAANPVAAAPHLRKAPLAGVPAKSVLFQLAKGDQTVPNPTNTAILRAGALADRATYFRNDLAFAANPAVPKNPHAFLTRLFVSAVAAVAAGAQQQIATFLASDGTVIVDPDGAGPLFEVPIVPPLPEDLSFIP